MDRSQQDEPLFAGLTRDGMRYWTKNLCVKLGLPIAEFALGSDEIGRLLLHPGTLHFVFSGGTGLISQLQLWLEREADGSPFVELTFAPEDVQPVEGLGQAFLAWVADMNQLLEARQFFVRYENASWRFGDVGPTSGVFLTSNLR